MILSCIISLFLLVSPADSIDTVKLDVPSPPQRVDSFPRPVPDYLPAEIFIPRNRLQGLSPWISAPITRPTFPILTVYGFEGSIGFGEYSLQHPEKFFSTLEGFNAIDVPQLYTTTQMMIGNTLKLGKNIYFLSGILYGSQMSVRANNWGMGTREGFIWHPSAIVTVMLWTQYFQSVSVYSPVVMPGPFAGPAAIVMPATPEVFSFGLQASFTVGEFIIGIGTSVAPVPFQQRHHSEFRYK